MIPFTSTRINYSAIIEADNKADRERQLQLKVNDEKRRKMKVILTENSMLRFNQLKNNISNDHAPILYSLKDSLLNLETNLDKTFQNNFLEERQSPFNTADIKLDGDKKIALHSFSESEKNLVNAHTDNTHNLVKSSQSDRSIENKLSSLELEWQDLFDQNKNLSNNENLANFKNLTNNKNISFEVNSHNFDNKLEPQDPLPVIKSSELDQEISKVRVNSSTTLDLLNVERVAIEKTNLIKDSVADVKLVELAAEDKTIVPDESTALKPSSLNSLVKNLEDIFDDIKSKKSSAEILLRIQDIEQGLNQELTDQELTESKIFSQTELRDLSCQIDFLDGYLQSESYSKDIQNKLIDSLNNSRSYLAQLENNNLLQKESKTLSVDNNLAILEDVIAMMSPLVINPLSPSNKAFIDNATNKNNSIDGIARLQQKNKEETLPLIVLKSV
jgi:hypothetical protein